MLAHLKKGQNLLNTPSQDLEDFYTTYCDQVTSGYISSLHVANFLRRAVRISIYIFLVFLENFALDASLVINENYGSLNGARQNCSGTNFKYCSMIFIRIVQSFSSVKSVSGPMASTPTFKLRPQISKSQSSTKGRWGSP